MRKRSFLGAVAVLAVVATACGGDDDDGGTASGTGSDGSSGGEFTLDEGVTFALLANTKGEDPAAVSDYADAFEMAVDEINAAGGIGGQPIDPQRFGAPPTDPAASQTALRKALDAEATAIIGFPAGAQAKPLAAAVKSGGVPFMYLAPDPSLYVNGPESVDNPLGFVIRTRQNELAEAVFDYVEGTGAEKIALFCQDGPYGELGCDTTEAAAEDAGVEVVAREKTDANPTDLTPQVQEIRSAEPDAIISYAYPNPVSLIAKQLHEAGTDVPIVGSGTPNLAVLSGALTGEPLANITSIDDCSPSTEDREVSKEFTEAFEAEYGYVPGLSAATTYDGVYLWKAAIEQAESVEPEQVAEALKSLTYEGVCNPEYSADDGNGLLQRAVVLTYDTDGTATQSEQITTATGE